MIGIIQKTLVECLLEAGGDDLRREVFADVGLDENHVFRMDRNYPDTDVGQMIASTLRRTGLAEEQLYALFCKTFVRFIREVFPQFFEMSRNSEDLVRKQAKIHALIAGGMRLSEDRSATNDKFHLEDEGAHRIVVQYKSPLQLCGLYRALVNAMVDEFGDEVEIETMDCRKKGADACRFCVRWTAIDGLPTEVEPLNRVPDAPLRVLAK